MVVYHSGVEFPCGFTCFLVPVSPPAHFGDLELTGTKKRLPLTRPGSDAEASLSVATANQTQQLLARSLLVADLRKDADDLLVALHEHPVRISFDALDRLQKKVQGVLSLRLEFAKNLTENHLWRWWSNLKFTISSHIPCVPVEDLLLEFYRCI